MKKFLLNFFPSLLLFLCGSLVLGLGIAIYGQVGRTPFPKPTSVWKTVDLVKVSLLEEKESGNLRPSWNGTDGPYHYEVKHLPKTVENQDRFLLKIISPEIRPFALHWLPDAWVMGLVLTQDEEKKHSISVVGFKEVKKEVP